MGLFDELLRLLFGDQAARPARRPEPSRPQSQPSRPPPVMKPSTVISQPAASAAPAAPATRAVAAAPVAPPAPKRKTLNLDVAQFAPISGAEAKKRARGLGSLWRSPFFGRRDLIPPASDERTNLIDRAMVGQGLLSIEELADIHNVGAEMDKIRPDILLAHSVADEAVRRSKDEREAIKKKKKEEAEARRKKHAEDVARRKQTEIIFLGRGVSTGLADTKANIEKLQSAKLPILAHPRDVAEALKIPLKQLRWLAYHSDASRVTHYIRFSVAKKSGGTRELAAPHRKLAQSQQWILENILNTIEPNAAAHGFVPKHSTLTNAAPHVRKAVVVNADLKDFFPTICFPRVKGLFQQLGYSPAAATILALLCTESPRREVEYAGTKYHVATGPRALPQGACTSPALSNLAARGMDGRLCGIARKLGWTYTRYADDLTFSADSSAGEKPGYLLARVRHIAQDEGFQVNEKKTRVQRRNTAQTVTSIVVNQRPGAPRKLVRRLRAILHRAKHEGLAAQNRDHAPNFEAWLQGMIAYVCMVNPAQGTPLKVAFQALVQKKS